MPNKREVLLAALRRVAGRCEYLDEANALREHADSLEADQELGGLAEQLQAVTAERDRARTDRDTAHAQADVAGIKLGEMETIAQGFQAERDEANHKIAEQDRELRSLRARLLLQGGAEEPAQPEQPTNEQPSG